MIYNTNISNNCTIKIACFEAEKRGEMHSIVTVDGTAKTFMHQVDDIVCGLTSLSNSNPTYTIVAIRLYLSDAANQAQFATSEIRRHTGECALAYIEQAPLNGSKIAALVYMQENATPTRVDDFTVKVEASDGLTHYWTANVTNAIDSTYDETSKQLTYLNNMLRECGCNIADNCVRTWFYVQNIDHNYADVVTARKEFFNRNGLTQETHYISSTGIGGRHESAKTTSIMDAYSIKGLRPGQMNYLYAADNMNRTSDYGVTFERGTTVDYGDRRHVIISGTASIDNKGQVVAQGDICAQTDRMIENVGALLKEAGSDFDDVAHIIVYLRDITDYATVKHIMSQKIGETPCLITLAPVCRPGWLIEMECMAISNKKSGFGTF